MLDFLQNYFDTVFGAFIDPRKRVSVLYLISALVLAWVWLLAYKKQNLTSSSKTIFDRVIWWSPSARLDYQILFYNQAIMLLIVPFLLSKLTLATWLFEQLHQVVDRPLWSFSAEKMWVMLGFTFTLFVLDDFAKFYLHRLMHRVPWLWAFHQVHHSARTMTPLTVYRTHPVEGVLFALRATLVQGFCLAVFYFCFGDLVDLLSVLGANAFLFVFNFLGSNLRHSHIHIHYWHWLERWLISPAQHHIHHSTAKRHWNKNYGAALAIWDRYWGSLHFSEPNHVFQYGIHETEDKHEQHLAYAYLLPFKQAYQSLTKSLYSIFAHKNHSHL